MAEHNPSIVVPEGAGDLEALRRMKFPELTIEQLRDLETYARRFGFDVWAGHVWPRMEPAGRNVRGNDVYRMVPVVGIHGLMSRARSTGLMGDLHGPFPHVIDGKLAFARVIVYRREGTDHVRVPGTAWLEEYGTGEGMWRTHPRHMLGKVATALALRAAFPDELGGVFCEEELDRRPPASKAPMPLSVVPREDGRVLDLSDAQV